MTHTLKFYLIIFVLSLLSAGCAVKNPVFKAETYKSRDGITLPYNIYYPEKYHSGKTDKYPLLIFLHGAGERGNDNKKQLVHIAPKLLEKETRNKYPAVLFFPQCPEEDYWAPVKRFEWTFDVNAGITKSMSALIHLVNQIIEDPKIDKNRIYISGLSMGGFGTYDYLSRMPDLFAAAVPICGGSDTTKIENYKHVPIWIFHGAKDQVVPVSLSHEVVLKLKKTGAQPLYKEYPEGGHDIWNTVYDDPKTLEWMFSQRKGKSNKENE